ncbi:MAG: hypothetical protein K8T90_01445 [Planctomycetes bacterium]|nr:hypothetical protein [Planctomycetota bacterium]
MNVNVSDDSGPPAAGPSGGQPDARPDGPPGETTAVPAPDPRDRRVGGRRSGVDRRAGTDPPVGVERRAGDRRGPDRRVSVGVAEQYRGNVRSINEYPLDADELEFINAVNAYRRCHDRPFPTWSEVLHVLRFLGYRKTTPPSGGTGEAEQPKG